MADNTKYTFTGDTGPEEPKPKDTDLDHDSPHHTLGRGPLQAASGVHKHSYNELNDIPAPGIVAHDHGTTYSLSGHTHGAVSNADTVDNMHFNWDDRGTYPTYLWGVSNYGDSYLVTSAKFRKQDSLKQQIDSPGGIVLHSPGVSVASIASFNYSGQYGIRFIADWQGDSGALAPLQIGAPIDGNSAARVDWVGNNYSGSGHGHGQTVRGGTYTGLTLAAGATGYVGIPNSMPFVPSGVAVVAYNDEGVQSIVVSAQQWDQTGIGVHCRNVGAGAETFDIAWVAAAW